MKRKFKAIIKAIFLLNIISGPHNVYGQETNDFYSESSEDISSSFEMIESNVSENVFEETSNLDETNLRMDFKDYMPFAKFVNYQYQGDGSLFETQDIIMEYMPDSQGIFQVAAFTGNSATAFVYQIRETGLFELAVFENYNIVEDLRYSDSAMDGVESLLLPNNVSEGQSFQSGYNKENRRTITEVIDNFSFGGYTFQNVIKIHEVQQNNQFYYYLAPEYGLILMERLDEHNNPQRIIQLLSTQGNVIE